MPLHLTADDVRRLSAVTEALLAPLSGADPSAWWTKVEERLRVLLGGANAMVTWPEGTRLRFFGRSVDRGAQERLMALTAADPVTGLHINFDPGVVAWFEHRRRHALQVWHETDAFRVSREAGIDASRGLFYNEGLVRAGFVDCSGTTTAAQDGEMFVTVGYDRRGHGRFGGAGDAEVLRMLLPVIRSAHHALATFAPRQAALAATIDAMRDALLVVAPDGRALHHNAALGAALAGEPARETVLRAMHALADEVRAVRRGVAVPRAERAVVTADARYALRATFASALLWGVEGAVQVSLERVAAVAPAATPVLALAPTLPAIGAVVEAGQAVPDRFGLTGREAEVVALLARRLSNAEVAAALGVSVHTARHHTERVLQKLGVRRRAEVAGVLLRAVQ